MERKALVKIITDLYFKRRNELLRANLAILLQIINLLTDVHTKRQVLSAAIILCCRMDNKERLWKHVRSSAFWECDVQRMTNEKFRENFRISRESFLKLCYAVRCIKKEDTVLRPAIPLPKRVGIAMYALGSSAEYRTVAHLFGVGLSTVSEIVLQFCQAVCDNFSTYISTYPPTDDEIRRIVGGFEQLGFPQCFGAIDGCHIEIQPSKDEAVDFYNYKGWYSTVLLAASDHKCKFTYLNIGSAGRNNDSYIFESSSLKRFHENSGCFDMHEKLVGNTMVPVVLIGDSAFRLSRFMMKPFPYKQNQPLIERNFNYNLSKCRRVIENTFGQLKARFRKLGKGLELAPKNCNVVIKACCLLHNFLIEEKEDVPPSWIVEHASTVQRIQPNHTTTRGDNDSRANIIRNSIALSLMDSGFNDSLEADGEIAGIVTVRGVETGGDDTGDEYGDSANDPLDVDGV